MLIIKIEKFLGPLERRKFNQLSDFVKNSQHSYVSQIKEDVMKLLGGKYNIGESGTHLWIHRKGSNYRLAIISKSG